MTTLDGTQPGREPDPDYYSDSRMGPPDSGLSDSGQSDKGHWRVARSRGLISGFMLLLLGLWGALIPFVGPAFNYAFTPDQSWTWTAGRFWLQVLPGAVVALCGLVLMLTASRAVAILAAWTAAVTGGWFIVGPTISVYWADSASSSDGPGVAVGSQTARVLEQIGFFSGLGGLIVFFAALVLGRLSVHSVRDVRAAEQRQAQSQTAYQSQFPPLSGSAAPTASTGSTASSASTAPSVPYPDGNTAAPSTPRVAAPPE